MLDVLRSFFRRPSEIQLAADRAFVDAGGTLKVAARRASNPTLRLTPPTPQGWLHVSKDRLEWTTGRHEVESLNVADWKMDTSPPAMIGRPSIASLLGNAWSIAVLVNRRDPSQNKKIGVPTADLQLLRWVLNRD